MSAPASTRALSPDELRRYLTYACNQCLTAHARDNCVGVHGDAIAQMRRRICWDFDAGGKLLLKYLPELCPFVFADKKNSAAMPAGLLRVVTHSLAPTPPPERNYPLRDADIKCPLGVGCPWAHTEREMWFHPLVYRNSGDESRACTRGAECKQKYCAYYHPAEVEPIAEELMARLKAAAEELQKRIDSANTMMLEHMNNIDKAKKHCGASVALLCGIEHKPVGAAGPAGAAACLLPTPVHVRAQAHAQTQLSTEYSQQIAIAVGNELHAIAVRVQSLFLDSSATLVSYTERISKLVNYDDFAAKTAITREEICSICRHAMELLQNALLDHFKCRIAPSWSLTDKCIQLKDHMPRESTRRFFELKELACLPDHHPRGNRERYQVSITETTDALYLMLSTLRIAADEIQKPPRTTAQSTPPPDPTPASAAATRAATPPATPMRSTATPFTPTTSNTRSNAGARHNRVPKQYKTSLCRNWKLHGDCAHGDRCAYAHGSRELRQ